MLKGCTKYVGSDRYAYLIVGIRNNGKELILEKPEIERADSNGFFSDQQAYTYKRKFGEKKIILHYRYGAWWELATCPDRIKRIHDAKRYNNPNYQPPKNVYWGKWSVGFDGMQHYVDPSF